MIMSWASHIPRVFGLHVRATFVAGFLIALPVVATYLILRVLFDTLDPLLKDVLEEVLPRYTPGMGIIALLILLYLIGLVATHVMGRRLIGLGHGALDLIPVVSSVYRTARQATAVLSAVNNPNDSFSGVVLVDFPGYGLKSHRVDHVKNSGSGWNTVAGRVHAHFSLPHLWLSSVVA